jgi:hypothetical protein
VALWDPNRLDECRTQPEILLVKFVDAKLDLSTAQEPQLKNPAIGKFPKKDNRNVVREFQQIYC